MSGWTGNLENFQEVFQQLKEIKQAIKEHDPNEIQAFIARETFHPGPGEGFSSGYTQAGRFCHHGLLGWPTTSAVWV